uniref:Uncharacterized protein n=2 Tax=Babesia bovis TaxID=5865 RepID=A7AVI8_BABBO|eukprot:XP_001609382.1 hypothetical protein [Babesia bovis T2Bo]
MDVIKAMFPTRDPEESQMMVDVSLKAVRAYIQDDDTIHIIEGQQEHGSTGDNNLLKCSNKISKNRKMLNHPVMIKRMPDMILSYVENNAKRRRVESDEHQLNDISAHNDTNISDSSTFISSNDELAYSFDDDLYAELERFIESQYDSLAGCSQNEMNPDMPGLNSTTENICADIYPSEDRSFEKSSAPGPNTGGNIDELRNWATPDAISLSDGHASSPSQTNNNGSSTVDDADVIIGEVSSSTSVVTGRTEVHDVMNSDNVSNDGRNSASAVPGFDNRVASASTLPEFATLVQCSSSPKENNSEFSVYFGPTPSFPLVLLINVKVAQDIYLNLGYDFIHTRNMNNAMGTYTGFAISRENVLNYRISGVIDASRHESTLFIEPPNALLSEVESFRCNDNLWHYVIIHTVCIGAGVPTVTQTIYQEVMDGNSPTYKKLDSIDAAAWALFAMMRSSNPYSAVT